MLFGGRRGHEHNRIIAECPFRYAEEVVYVVRYIALIAIILSILSLLFFGLCLIVVSVY